MAPSKQAKVFDIVERYFTKGTRPAPGPPINPRLQGDDSTFAISAIEEATSGPRLLLNSSKLSNISQNGSRPSAMLKRKLSTSLTVDDDTISTRTRSATKFAKRSSQPTSNLTAEPHPTNVPKTNDISKIKVSPLELLPTEIQHQILKYLSPLTLRSVALVSSELHSSINGLASYSNATILTRFAAEDALFSSQIQSDGWLCPSVSAFSVCCTAQATFGLKCGNVPIHQQRNDTRKDPLAKFSKEIDPKGYYALGPQYVIFLEFFSKWVKPLARVFYSICRHREPEIEWDAAQLESMVMRWAAGQGLRPFEQSRASVVDQGVVFDVGRVWDCLPGSVRAVLERWKQA